MRRVRLFGLVACLALLAACAAGVRSRAVPEATIAPGNTVAATEATSPSPELRDGERVVKVIKLPPGVRPDEVPATEHGEDIRASETPVEASPPSAASQEVGEGERVLKVIVLPPGAIPPAEEVVSSK